MPHHFCQLKSVQVSAGVRIYALMIQQYLSRNTLHIELELNRNISDVGKYGLTLNALLSSLRTSSALIPKGDPFHLLRCGSREVIVKLFAVEFSVWIRSGIPRFLFTYIMLTL